MKSILSILLSLTLFNTSFGQWMRSTGPFGDNIVGIANVGNNIYLAGSEGVHLTANNGTTWTTLKNGLGYPSTAIAAIGSKLFSGAENFWTGGGSLFVSNDGGNSWSYVNGFNGGRINAILHNGSDIFLATSGNNSGVYLSTDEGVSWSPMNNGMGNTKILSLAVKGTKLFAGTASGKVYLSENNGVLWTDVSNDLPFGNHVTSILVSGNNIFVGKRPEGIFVSGNDGESWTAMNTGLTNTSVLSLSQIGTNIMAGTLGGGIFKSTNNGASWEPANLGIQFSSTTAINEFHVNGTNLFAATSRGIYISGNSGILWIPITYGIAATQINAFTSNGIHAFAGAFNIGVFRSSDNGLNWTQVNTGLENTNVSALATNGTYIFAGTYYDGVFVSSNNGNSWVAASTGLPIGLGGVQAFAVKESSIFVSIAGLGIFRTNDNAANWISVNNGLENNYVNDFAVSGSYIFAGTNAGIYLSSDNGNSWTQVNSGLTNTFITAMLAHGSNIYAGTLGGGVFYSSNNGTSWATANTGLSNHVITSFSKHASVIYVGTTNGIFYSTDNASSWALLSGDLPGADTKALGVNNSKLFASISGEGVWARDHIATTAIEDISNEINFEGYPNPVSDLLIVKFNPMNAGSPISEESKFEFKFTDVTGRLVFQSIPNTGEIFLDVSSVPNGLYFAHLRKGNKVATKKIVVHH